MSLFVCAETSDYVCWCQTCNCQLLFCVILVPLGPLDLLECGPAHIQELRLIAICVFVRHKELVVLSVRCFECALF